MIRYNWPRFSLTTTISLKYSVCLVLERLRKVIYRPGWIKDIKNCSFGILYCASDTTMGRPWVYTLWRYGSHSLCLSDDISVSEHYTRPRTTSIWHHMSKTTFNHTNQPIIKRKVVIMLVFRNATKSITRS